MSADSVITAKNLCYRYEGAQTDAVRGVDLDVKRGEFLAILGRNGSGKSTLGKMLNGLYPATSGELTVCGIHVENEDDAYEVRRRCGIVFQDPDNQMVATIVEEDVAFGCENIGLDSHEIRHRVSGALKTVGMEEYALTAPHMLSGGQKQRVAIAGVIAMKPEIIVFDESTSMLDPSGREDIFNLAMELNAQGVTIVWITHFMEEAARAERIVVIDGGEEVLTGTPREVFRDARRMEELGLDIPVPTRLLNLIKNSGIDIRTDLLTREETEVELCRLK